MSILSRLFGRTPEAERIRLAEERIAVELESVADDLAEHRKRRREVLGHETTSAVNILPVIVDATPTTPREEVKTALEKATNGTGRKRTVKS